MSTDQTKRKELMRRWIEALNARDLSQLDELAEEITHKDFIMHDPSTPAISGRGPAVWKAFAHGIVATNSHIHMTFEDFFGESDKTATRLAVRTTSASTGKTVSFPVLFISRWVGDKVAEEWELVGPPEEQP
jgi:hypothetical protein